MGGVRLRLTTSETLLSAGLVAWGLSEAVALPSDSPLAARVVLALLATVPLAFRNAAPGGYLAMARVFVKAVFAGEVGVTRRASRRTVARRIRARTDRRTVTRIVTVRLEAVVA